MKNPGGSKKRRIVVLLGSPRRKGHSTRLAKAIAAGAAAKGAEVTSFYLHGLKIAPCSACEGCHRPGAKGCVIRDDMDAIYAAARRADAIVFASPIYWFTVSAQLKLAIDRFYSLIGPRGHAFAGKRIALAFSYGGDDPYDSGCVNAIRTFQDAFRFIGAPIAGLVYGQAGAAGDTAKGRALLREARELGGRLAAG
jgi:multimeric flavodoxin WrbA